MPDFIPTEKPGQTQQESAFLPGAPGQSIVAADANTEAIGNTIKAEAAGVPAMHEQYQPAPWENKPEHLGELPEFMPGAHEWEVTKEQTVAGQLEQNLARDNPLYEQVRDRVTQSYASRGLKNSAMAATAAEMAVVDLAFQVSATDAATFARSAEFNATVKNHFSAAEQAFIHNALLSDQNFKQSQVLLREQIAGQMAAVSAQAASQRASEAHQLRAMEIGHAQNLETIAAQHALNLDSMSFATELEMDRMGWASELGMNEAAFASQLDIQRMDRGLLHELTRMDVQFGQAQQLNYQQMVGGMLNASFESMAHILATAKPKHQQAAVHQVQDMITSNINLLGSFFGAPGGPMTQAGGGATNPAADYTSWGNNRRRGRDATVGSP